LSQAVEDVVLGVIGSLQNRAFEKDGQIGWLGSASK